MTAETGFPHNLLEMPSSLNSGEIVAVSIGCYIFVAIILVRLAPFSRWTKSSVLAHLRERFHFRAKNIAHRGGSLIGPENTLFTFKKGVADFGVDMLEMDVNESADGEIIVSHDSSLARVCDGEHSHLEIKDIVVGGDPNKNLPQLARRMHLHFSSKDTDEYDADRVPGGYTVPINSETRFPLLREVFEAFPQVPIHLDVKYPSLELTRKVVELVEEHNREGITIVGTAGPNQASLNHLLSIPSNRRQKIVSQQSPLLPESPRRARFLKFASFSEIVKTYALFYLGLLPIVPLDYDVCSIPLPTKA